MKFDPQTFFIGLIDFFSILLPGGLLAYAVRALYFSAFILNTTESWIVFLFASYLLGHFIFLLGSVVLDKYVYDIIRDGTHDRQVNRLAAGKKLAAKPARWLAQNLLNHYADLSLRAALSIKAFYLNPLLSTESINAFQWCKVRLEQESSPSLSTVQRFEANSKFFRSLFVVFFILLLLNIHYQNRCPIDWDSLIVTTGGLLVSLALSLWRYADQREKSTTQAYWSILTLEAGKKDGFRQYPSGRTDGITHAGGIVFRKEASTGSVSVLLIRPKNGENIWVLPKGHVEPGEVLNECAVREVMEETGIWGRILDPSRFEDFDFEIKATPDSHVKGRLYPMEFQEEIKSKRLRKQMRIEKRELNWMSEKQVALEKNMPDEVKSSLKNFFDKLPTLSLKHQI